ncbi:uncharacterized protein plekhg6 isoform 2-T2 [Pholidichthys leucotaenia]
MDPAKPSSSVPAASTDQRRHSRRPSSKGPHLNSGGGNESRMEDMEQRRDGMDGEKQKEAESREPDGAPAAAEINLHHKGSADKQKYSTLGYQRRTKQKVVTDFATLSKGASAGAKSRTPLRQVLFSQGVSDKASEERSQVDVLKQILDATPRPVNLKWRWKEESEGTTLEKSWTDIVQSHSTMSKMQRHQQEALWEFIHTELTYINKLIIIKDFVIKALVYVQQHRFLLEVTPELLFFNVASILLAHQLFWQEIIFPMVQEVRRTGKPFDPMRLEAGCLQFHERFSSYQDYCWEEENNLEFTRRMMESSPHFLTYVQWVEAQPQTERMRLGDMQAKPHQRITKYPLLLKAVHRNTQDPHVQNALRGMLSSVNSFLESINDYLRLKDEELALSISSQRVEGYEVEAINEEIDRHVREICQFDLTFPIRGVGPKVVRKLLLEENLKVRGRKDSKLELVALLFSDVFLLTKVQKKGERLKVVRPPLALDRMHCTMLKDGYSFLLVEIGELQSAMNVLILVASTPENCSKWVTTIHQAKETLKNLRETENHRLENLKTHQRTAEAGIKAKTDDIETEQQPVTDTGGETYREEFTEEPAIAYTRNGSAETELYLAPDEESDYSTRSPFWQPQSSEIKHKVPQKRSIGRRPVFKGYEWIEMGLKGDQDGNHREEEEEEEDRIAESPITNELNVSWDHKVQSAPNLHYFNRIDSQNTLKHNTTWPHNLLPGELPDVDYPTDEDSTSQLNHHPTMREELEFSKPHEQQILTRKDSDFQSVNLGSQRNSGLSVDMETSVDTWSFSKNLKSPNLRRRRPVSTGQVPSLQASMHLHQGSDQSLTTSKYYSSSDSDSSQNFKRNSLTYSYRSDPQQVLKLGSLKLNQGMFCNTSQDFQTLSESELNDVNFLNKKIRMKAHRSASIPNTSHEGGPVLRLHSRSLNPSTQQEDECPSPLKGLLERAKGRERDREEVKRDINIQNQKTNYLPPPSPLFSIAPLPPPSEGDRDTDWEEVELMRPRAPTVSKGWKEQLVDGDDDDKGNSVIFSDGVNVDWAGWCFDDEEVLDQLHPGNDGLLEGVNRSLSSWGLSELLEQDDGECSQV